MTETLQTETMKNAELQAKPFDVIRRANPVHLLNLIQQEHPQTLAVILSYLEPNKASFMLQYLPHEVQSDVTLRIACMDRIRPEVLKRIEQVLEKKLSTISSEDCYAAGGVESVVEILNLVDRVSERRILEALEDEEPELAEEIKSRMFVFEDIVRLDDRSIQKVMREVDSQELAKALISVSATVQNKFFMNMSKRAAGMLKEDMDYMGPVRLREVEYAQQKLLSIIRHLEDAGEIVVPRAGEEVLVAEYIKPEFGWDDILSLKANEVEKLLAEVDHHTLAIALTLTRLDIINKLTKPMGFFKRFRLKQAMRKLKDLSVHDVASAQNDIISSIHELLPSDNTETGTTESGNTETEDAETETGVIPFPVVKV